MGLFVIIVNGFKALTIIAKSSILDLAEVLDPPLGFIDHRKRKIIEITANANLGKN